MSRSLRNVAFLSLIAATAALHPGTAKVANADDPFSEILQSKNLKERGGGIKRAKESKLRYKLGPWFQKGSNFERLFKDAGMADSLIEWIAPVGKQFLVSEPEKEHADTHIHVAAIVQERATRSTFGLTVLVPHPAFLTVIEGKLVDDFSQRLPPQLKVENSEQFKLQGFDATAYSLASERCTLVVNVAHHTMVELRSVDVCPSLKTIRALAESLNLIKLDQRLQS